MGRISTLVLIGLGAFLLVLAPVLRFGMARQLVAAPADHFGVSHFEAKGARYFSNQALKVLTADLDITVTTRGDVRDADARRVVWDEATVVDDRTNGRKSIDFTDRRSAFDRFSGVGVNCCGVEYPAAGQIHKWPFDVAKRTYQVFDPTVRKAFDARFVREEEVNGLSAYVFEQVVPPAKISTQSLPAHLAGVTGVEGAVELDRWYDGKTAYWVEPVTGALVKQETRRHEVLKTRDGVERSAAFVATVKMTDRTVGERVASAGNGRDRMILLRDTIPLTLLLAGASIVVAGALVERRRRVPPERHRPQIPD